MTRLEKFDFVSEALSGEGNSEYGNRFRGTFLGKIRVPLPEQAVLGVDIQRGDLENFGQAAYLGGEWKDEGWWYYYLYGLAVKSPLGTQVLLIAALLSLFVGRSICVMPDTVIHILLPAAVIMFVASTQTGLNHHVRYVLIAWGYVSVFLGGYMVAKQKWVWMLATVCIVGNAASAVWAYPNHLGYFNEAVGGRRGGILHLAHSNLDWGQYSRAVVTASRMHDLRDIEYVCFTGFNQDFTNQRWRGKSVSFNFVCENWDSLGPGLLSPMTLLDISRVLKEEVKVSGGGWVLHGRQIREVEPGVLLVDENLGH